MVKSQYVSLQDAALLSDKSPQTIRRLIKSNKIRYRKYKTPQGFTYLVEKTSLLDHYTPTDQPSENGDVIEEAELVEDFDPTKYQTMNEQAPTVEQVPRDHRPTVNQQPPTQQTSTSQQTAGNPRPFAAPTQPNDKSKGSTHTDPGYQAVITQLVQQHREDKKRLFELLEIFQKRIFTLEEQIKQLEAPKEKKSWLKRMLS